MNKKGEETMKKKDTFGINMTLYCKNHQALIESALQEGQVTRELYETHREKIQILQHERLVHLIVTAMVVFVELFVVDLTVLHVELGLLPPILMLGLAVLLGFYFVHYFFLENTVQHWYRLEDEMREALSRKG